MPEMQAKYPMSGKTAAMPATADGADTSILVADDDHKNRQVLEALLKKSGFKVLLAEDGERAVEIFSQELPDIVMISNTLPTMSGYEAVRHIKALAGESFVPVIFLTAMSNPAVLAKCIKNGGDDFFIKPYKQAIVQVKTDALLRIKRLYATLKSQKDELKEHEKLMRGERETARRFFEKLIDTDIFEELGIRYLLSPMGLFNGDLLLAARRPSGALRLMLGDLTGHGLSAAVGAVPVTDVFYKMTEKGHSISGLVTEINSKLRMVFPTGLFCCACVIEIDARGRRLIVWNGGMPDILVCGNDRKEIKRRIPSQTVPLGVVDSDRLDCGMQHMDIQHGDRIYLCSDGVVEARNPRGELLGQPRLEKLIQQVGSGDGFEQIVSAINAFIAGVPSSDDTTLAEVTCDLESGAYEVEHSPALVVPPPSRWCVNLELDVGTLRTTDPRPLLTQLVMDMQGLMNHREHIFTILAELFNNALEHGVIGLDSALKKTSNGFSEYYRLRQENLSMLDKGWIKIFLDHRPLNTGGELIIRVEDSGKGFEWRDIPLDPVRITAYSGRGIHLVRSLCQELRYEGCGNRVYAVYTWS